MTSMMISNRTTITMSPIIAGENVNEEHVGVKVPIPPWRELRNEDGRAVVIIKFNEGTLLSPSGMNAIEYNFNRTFRFLFIDV